METGRHQGAYLPYTEDREMPQEEGVQADGNISGLRNKTAINLGQTGVSLA